MGDVFLTKTRVEPGDFVEADGQRVLERFGELRALLVERAGPEAAALFAEPLVSRGNDEAAPTVSWYGEGSGEARPLAALEPAARDRAEAWLADHLRPLRALAEDPAHGELVLGALSVQGAGDVMVVDDHPVIVNWGLLPGGAGAHAGQRPEHYAATLGKYLPLGAAAVSAGASETAAASAPKLPPGMPPVADTAQGGGGPVPPAPSATRPGTVRAVPPIAWVPLVVLLLLAGLALLWILWPGNRLFPAYRAPVAITDADRLDAARALNDSLRERRAALQAALEGAVCRPDGVLVLPDGRTPEGLLPPAPGAAPEDEARAAPDAMLPNAPDRVLTPAPEAGAPRGTLLELIEARTVLVLAPNSGKLGVGSGFFVGPGLIVTNHHVIDGGDSILVTGPGMDAPQRARVVKRAGPLDRAGADFALLEIEDPGVVPFDMYLGDASLKLTNVIAAGYPGDVLQTDAAFARLQAGDLEAVPGLTVTDGVVNTEQRMGSVTNVLMHSAPLSSGNSGGPLVDMCGRVVGVNTFVRQGRMQNRGFALATGDLLAFLEGTGARPAVVSAPCAPVVARAAALAVEIPADTPPAQE